MALDKFTQITKSGIVTTINFECHHLHSTGIATFSAGSITAGGNVTAVDGTFSGNVSVGGTLTYQDVTNIDSVGLVTARTGVRVTAGGIDVTAGVSTFAAAIDANGGVDISGGSGLVASTAKISDLTDNRVVVAGSSGELEDSANLTFDGSNLGVGSKVTVTNANADSRNLNSLGADINAAWIRLGDKAASKTFSNGLGIKFHDQGTAHWSTGTIGNQYYVSYTGSAPDELFPSSRVDALTFNTTGAAVFASDITAGGNLYIPDRIYHTGDTNTQIRFPAADTVSFETAGDERLLINSDGDICINQSGVIDNAKLSIKCDATQPAIAIQANHTNTDTKLISAWNSSGKNIINLTTESDNSPYLKVELWSTVTNSALERFRVNHLGNVAIGGGIAASNKLEITDDPKGFPSDSAQPNASFLIKHGTSGSNRRWVGIGASLTGAWIQSSSPGGSGLSAPLWINKGGGDVTLGNDKFKINSSGVLFHSPSGNYDNAYLKGDNTSSTYFLKAQKNGSADTNLSFNVQDAGSLKTLLYLRGDNKTVAVGPDITPYRQLHVQEHFLVANKGTNSNQPYVSSTPILAVGTDGQNVVPSDSTYRHNALVSFGVGGHNAGNPAANSYSGLCPALPYFKLDLYGQTGVGDVGTNLDSTLSIRSINPNNTRLRIRTKDNYNGTYPDASISFTQQQSTEIARIECDTETGAANRADLVFYTNYGGLEERLRITDQGQVRMNPPAANGSSSLISEQQALIGTKHFYSVFHTFSGGAGSINSPLAVNSKIPTNTCGTVEIMAGWANGNGLRYQKYSWIASGATAITQRFNDFNSRYGVGISVSTPTMSISGDWVNWSFAFSDSQGSKMENLKIHFEYFHQFRVDG